MPIVRFRSLRLLLAVIGAASTWLAAPPAGAFVIELNDVAPLRIEWQRMFARGEMPLPRTPKLKNLNRRLAQKGLKAGSPIFIRVFKAESELELWILKGRKYVLFETYPICHWSGSLGPKLSEGDKQNPEGFYAVGRRQMRRWGKWPRSINIGFPNRFDRAHQRTGSYILVHGGCSSVGCFAMTNPVMNEVHKLAHNALRGGQARFQFHIFPYRMTEEHLAIFARHSWYDFWLDLKQGYDSFERTRVPPKISLCGKRYLVQDAAGDEIEEHEPMSRIRPVRRNNYSGADRCFIETATHKGRKGSVRHASSNR